MPPRKTQPEGAVQGERCAARTCKGEGGAARCMLEKGAPWKRACGRPLLPPRRHSPKGQCRGRGARRGMQGRGSAPWKRACGGRSCFPARHSPKGTQGRAGAARHAREGKRAMEAGLREAAPASPQGTVRRGRREERVRGAGMHGEEARHGSGLAEAAPAASQGTARRGRMGERVRGASCMEREARHGSGLAEAAPASPQGTVRRGKRGHGRGSAARCMLEKGAPWKRACGGALAAPQGTVRRGSAGGEVRGAGMHEEEARHGSGFAEAAPASPQAQSEGAVREIGCAARHAREGKRGKTDAGLREVLLPLRRHSPKGQCRGRGARRGMQGRGSAPWKRACGGRSCFPARHSPKGTQGRAGAARHAREGKRAMEAGLREALLPPRRHSPKGQARAWEERRAMEAGLREAALAASQGTARRDSAGGEVRGADVQGRAEARRVAC